MKVKLKRDFWDGRQCWKGDGKTIIDVPDELYGRLPDTVEIITRPCAEVLSLIAKERKAENLKQALKKARVKVSKEAEAKVEAELERQSAISATKVEKEAEKILEAEQKAEEAAKVAEIDKEADEILKAEKAKADKKADKGSRDYERS